MMNITCLVRLLVAVACPVPAFNAGSAGDRLRADTEESPFNAWPLGLHLGMQGYHACVVCSNNRVRTDLIHVFEMSPEPLSLCEVAENPGCAPVMELSHDDSGSRGVAVLMIAAREVGERLVDALTALVEQLP